MTKNIDTDRFKFKDSHKWRSDHNVKYCVFYDSIDKVVTRTDEELEKIDPQWNTNNICFAALINNIKVYDNSHSNNANRVMYFIQRTHYTLPIKERLMWIKRCVRNKMLPEYILEQDLRGDRFVLDITRISPSLLYVYLSALRNIQEDLKFVKTALVLTGKYRMNFAAAFAVASRFAMGNSWHNIIGLGKKYGDTGNIAKLEVPLHLIIALKRYLNNASKYDRRELRNGHIGSNDTISKASAKLGAINCTAEQLLCTPVRKALRVSSDKKVLEYLREASIVPL